MAIPAIGREQAVGLGAIVVFYVWTLIEVTAFGFFEQPDLSVPYFYSGAGAWRTLARGLISVVFPVVFLFKLQSNFSSSRKIVLSGVTLLMPFVFYLSVIKIERFAPGYSDAKFMSVASALSPENRRTLHKTDVEKAVGKPLLVDHHDGRERWSYTFMPSSGFGWSKRLLYFKDDGTLVDWMYLNEP